MIFGETRRRIYLERRSNKKNGKLSYNNLGYILCQNHNGNKHVTTQVAKATALMDEVWEIGQRLRKSLKKKIV